VRRLSTLRHLYLYDAAEADLTALREVKSLTIHVRRRQKVRGAELLGEGSRVVRDG
jgi:hypothetical protein